MDAPDLQQLIELPSVWERQKAVEARLLEVATSDDPFLTEVAQHLIRAGGKRFRPLLAQIAAEFGDNDGGVARDGRPVDAGAAVELIHIGSLYHDDVIDEASTRRAAVSVNANWSNTIAILAGDFLLARASELAATSLGQEAVRLLAVTYAQLVEGQMLELQLDFDVEHGPDQYYKVIGDKTASLIRTSARLGALAADAAPETVEALSTWAWELGLVFQLTDDALDLVATDDVLGKPAGSDIGEGKFTLPVLYALDGPEGDTVRSLLADGPGYSREAVEQVIEITRRGGYVDQVLKEATARAAVAEQAVANLPEVPAKAVLSNLGGFLVDRVLAARAASA